MVHTGLRDVGTEALFRGADHPICVPGQRLHDSSGK